MVLWFAGGACVVVWFVFRDPRIDFRLVAAGALLPDVPLRMTPLHSLPVVVAALALVMVVTRRGSAGRRRALAVVIGMFLHLVLDGMWARAHEFWWPFFGWGLDGRRLPSLERGAVVLVLQEVAGLVGLWWLWGQVADGPDRPDRAGEVPTC